MKKLLIAILVIISTSTFATEPTDTLRIKTLDMEFLEQLVIEEISKYRVNSGKSPIVWDSTLSSQCREYSEKLKHDFKHDTNSPYHGECISNTGYNAGATYLKNAKTIVKIWQDSPGHNYILLLPNSTMGGMGIVLEGGFGNGLLNTFRISYNDLKQSDIISYSSVALY